MAAMEEIRGYRLLSKLGSGSDAEVYLGHDTKRSREVAIKVVSKQGNSTEKVKRVRKEAANMAALNHANVIKLFDFFETEEDMFLVMEYAKSGDMFEALYSPKLNPSQTVFEEDCARKLFRQTLAAVEHCHKQGIAHRDLKPENILLDEKLNVKLTDFGLSLRYSPDKLVCEPVGSLIYAAPEVLRRQPYVGPELDVWSLGVLLYEILCGTPPFCADTERELCERILEGEYLIPDFISRKARSLISSMLKLSPWRISLEDIKKHPWLTEDAPLPKVVKRKTDRSSSKRRGKQGGNNEDKKEPIRDANGKSSKSKPKNSKSKAKTATKDRTPNEQQKPEYTITVWGSIIQTNQRIVEKETKTSHKPSLPAPCIAVGAVLRSGLGVVKQCFNESSRDACKMELDQQQSPRKKQRPSSGGSRSCPNGASTARSFSCPTLMLL